MEEKIIEENYEIQDNETEESEGSGIGSVVIGSAITIGVWELAKFAYRKVGSKLSKKKDEDSDDPKVVLKSRKETHKKTSSEEKDETEE